jgi:hypothetical protein
VEGIQGKKQWKVQGTDDWINEMHLGNRQKLVRKLSTITTIYLPFVKLHSICTICEIDIESVYVLQDSFSIPSAIGFHPGYIWFSANINTFSP